MHDIQTFSPFLTDLGLKPQEAAVYLACLQLGQSTVGPIAQAAKVQRTFVYDILEKLHKQDLTSSLTYNGRRYFSAVSIEKLKILQEEKLKRLEGIIPELKAFQQTVGDRPKVQVYEGKESITAALHDSLTIPAGSEILGYSAAQGIYANSLVGPDYVKERVRHKIRWRGIITDTPGAHIYTDRDTQELRTTRLVSPELFPFTNEVIIYANKVAMTALSGEAICIIIESESIATHQRAVFELAWRGAKIPG